MTPEPIQTEFGWHVILVTDRRPGSAPPFEEVASYIEDQISRVAIDEFYAGLKEGVVIERFNMDGTPIVEVEALPADDVVPSLAPDPALAPAPAP
jgi:peptidyl-prolyl cis-trans isomerase C